MHPAISVNTLCLGSGALDDHVDVIARLGASAISVTLDEVQACGPQKARKLIADAGLAIATLTHRAFAFATAADADAGRDRLNASLAAAESIGAQSITFTTGARGALTWRDAAQRFAAEIAPCAARAREAGIALSLEPTSHLYADVSIAHRLSDTVRLARAAGISVGVDLFACWFDADIEDAILAAAPICALVQVSDYVYGDRGLPCRAIPGDGNVPLERLIPLIAQTGFKGFYDLEIIGPRSAGETVKANLVRAGDFIAALI